MKSISSVLSVPAAAATLIFLSCLTGSAQDAKGEPSAEQQAAAAMAAYMEMIKPGPEHKLLEQMVGLWKAEQKLWMMPGAPPAVASATAKFQMLLGGRYLVQDYQSEIPGMGKFSGRGTTAFDKATKEFVNTWMDSFGTGMMVSKGTADKENPKVISLVGESVDPITKNKVKFRTVSKYISVDHHEMEMFEQREGGEERKIMQIVYKRDKEAEAKAAEGKEK